MTTTNKIILISASTLTIGVIGYFLYKRFGKKDNKTVNIKAVENLEEKSVEKVEELVKEKPELKEVEYKSSPNYIELKKDLAKVYDIFSNEQFEMCPTQTPQIINCKNGEAYSKGATQGVWIMLQRYFKDYQNKFLTNEKNDAIKEYGQLLINSADVEFNRIFQPQFYNTTTNWYSDYIKKGGTPIPS